MKIMPSDTRSGDLRVAKAVTKEGNMDRVLLRRPVHADGSELIKSHFLSKDYHFPWVEPFLTDAGFETWFTQKMTGPHVSFLVIDAVSDSIAGVVNISEIVAGVFQSAYLGFYGMARHAGKGLITEAVGQTIRFAFDDLGLHRLEANIQPGNVRSIAVVKRLGFQLEGYSPRYLRIGGEWCDHERWAILAE
jgi:[ribosomal protein S5]-alanine N-acetyltransferase